MSTAPLPRLDRDLLPPDVAPLGRKDPESVGPYRMLGRIARDATGKAMLGVAPDGSTVVVRVVLAEVADATNVRARLTAEVGRLVRGRAVCAPRYRGSDVQAARPWLATEYVPGPTLAEHVAEHGPLRGNVLTALAAGLAEALSSWHALDGAHLGLNPAKVVLSPQGPKVVDFGLARAVGKVIGDRRWAAPEQRGDGTEPTGHADVFAWGNLVRFAATGWEPSGDTVAEPDLGDVPESLAPLIREALREEPGERPTAPHLLRELTGRSEGDLGAAVSELLTETWTGVTVPEPRRVRGSRTPVLVGTTAGVLAAALLSGWLMWDPGAEVDDAAAGGSADSADPTSADEDGPEDSEGATESSEDEPTGPTIDESPEDADAVAAEAKELALEAGSFTAYEHNYHSRPGDTIAHHYVQTQEPVPALLLDIHMITGGLMAIGPDLEEVVYFDNTSFDPEAVSEREYYRDEEQQRSSYGHPRERWEGTLDSVFAYLDPVDATYAGTGTAPTEYLPAEVLGDGALTERTGHRYTATYIEEDHGEHGDVAAVLEFWVDEDGYPLYFDQNVALDGEDPDTGLPNESGYRVEFAHFDEPVDLHVPAEDEILPERPGF